jgi:hypothetical protein
VVCHARTRHESLGDSSVNRIAQVIEANTGIKNKDIFIEISSTTSDAKFVRVQEDPGLAASSAGHSSHQCVSEPSAGNASDSGVELCFYEVQVPAFQEVCFDDALSEPVETAPSALPIYTPPTPPRDNNQPSNLFENIQQTVVVPAKARRGRPKNSTLAPFKVRCSLTVVPAQTNSNR